MSDMTPIDKEIYEQLFKDVPYINSIDNREEMSFCIANNHLKTIWGNRADWENNYSRFIKEKKES